MQKNPIVSAVPLAAPLLAALALTAMALTALAPAAQAQAQEPKAIPISCKAPAAAEVEHAQLLLDNVRVAEATTALQKAISLDPHCALAHGILATIVPPAELKKELELAQADAASASPAERTQIEIVAAANRGDNAKARELQVTLVEQAPGDWRAHNGLGGTYLGDRAWDKASAEFKKAIELNPKAAGAYNNLGYTYAGQDRYEEAATTFRKYAEVAPDEPNAHDSLAEVLMNGGHLAESEVEFQAALKLQPKFAGAWTGIAQTRYLRGDWKGGDAALAREKETDMRPQAEVGRRIQEAYARLAEGKAEECMKILDQTTAKAKKQKLPAALFIPAIATRLLDREGDKARALKLARQSLASTEASDLAPGPKQGVLRGVLIEVVRAEAAAGHVPEAQAAAARYEQAVESVAQIGFFTSQRQNVRGLAALASGDAKTAVAEMKQCLAADFICQYDLVRAEEKAGDTAGAAAARDALLRTPRRGIEYVHVWRKLGGKPSGGGTG